ncbi:hypothetical protein M0R72_05895 [Candidatus Pacearchaeota archaeon]|jgi:hypothetical protein|nr:hypothetical protein [Candidatus Pacearchaeota archaeon]
MIIDPEMVLHALELSISSHELRADGGYGARWCALCDLFKECDECPICKMASLPECSGTPYHRTIDQRDHIMLDPCATGCESCPDRMCASTTGRTPPCPIDCVYIDSCRLGETEYCIIEEENMISFLKWVRYNIKMGWV